MVSLPGALHKPNFRPKWRKPTMAKMIKEWPPARWRSYAFAFSDADFASIAKAHDLPNVWDLIIFNFQTEVPREVNWYLHHAVGCWKSKDGMNFSLGDAYTADYEIGRIYIPERGWKPDARFKRGSGWSGQSHIVKDTCRRILSNLSYKMPTIYHHATYLPRRAYQTVADLVDLGEVSVLPNHELGLNGAEYDYDDKVIYLGSNAFLFRPLSYGILANEATHVYNHFVSNSTNGFNEEVASSMAESIAVALIDKNESLDLMRTSLEANRKGDDTNKLSLLHFLGWVYVTHLKSKAVVNLESFNGLYEHPISGEQRNPKNDMIKFHESQALYSSKKTVQYDHVWD